MLTSSDCSHVLRIKQEHAGEMPGTRHVLNNGRNCYHYSVGQERWTMTFIGAFYKLCTVSGDFTITISLYPHHTRVVERIIPILQVRNLAHRGGVICPESDRV